MSLSFQVGQDCSPVRMGLRPTNLMKTRVGRRHAPPRGFTPTGASLLAEERAYEARAGCEPNAA